MEDTFIYNASLLINQRIKTYTIAFLHHHHIDFPRLLSHLKIHFQENPIPDHLIIIAAEHLRDSLEANLGRTDLPFREIIPTRYYQENLFSHFASIYLFNQFGELRLIKGYRHNTGEIIPSLLRIGLVEIFNLGGLISSQKSHHFVFPSGKHCDKFLRTGNILIKSQHIFFIAFNLLSRYRENYEIIYCDTSSINSLAFALIELKRRLDTDFVCPHIESYGSYKGFEESEFVDRHKALFIISSSTSANIIDRLKERMVEENRIILVYCLKPTKYQQLVVCDLALDSINTKGITPFKTYPYNEKCELCDSGSMPVLVQGDVFLLEKPVVNKIQISTTDAPANLSKFVEDYRHKGDSEKHFFRCNYFESSVRQSSSTQFGYEVFFDIDSTFEDLNSSNPTYEQFKVKLDRHIHQYIPSNTKYIIYLNDAGSKSFAQYLLDKLSPTIRPDFVPSMIPINQIVDIPVDIEGAALIVSSSMVSGGNLIYVSKEMRKFKSLSLIYLVGFARTNNEEYFKFIKSNLTQGVYGPSTNSYYSIETIHCNNDYKNTSWLIEQDFVKNLLEFVDDNISDAEEVLDFFKARDVLLSNSLMVQNKGMFENIFYPNVYTDEVLKINKNFAFFKFHGYDEDVSQADIYFTLSTVLNRLRHTNDLKHCLIQTEYVRNIIDPENFARYNDGIIQASILRAARPLELAYDIDIDLSRKFMNLIAPIVIQAKNNYGEALMEFLFAIAIRKLRIQSSTLVDFLALIHEKCGDNKIISAMCAYIQTLILDKDGAAIKKYGITYDLI